MKKSFTIIALAALVMLAGCKKNEQPTGSTKLIAGIEQQKNNSKTSLDGLQIKWTADDQLYVYDKDAEQGAIFTLSSGAGTSTGEFTGTYNFTNENVAVYPSSSFSGSGGTIVTMTLPAVQTASGSGTFGNGANPMLGVFSDFNNLTLKSLCGVLCLQLTGNNVNITAIEIVGGPDDKLNGTFTANYKDTDPVLVKTGDDGNNTVTLNCPATLTSTAQKFYVVLPAGTLANGFTMKVYNGTNVIFSKATTHDITMHLNTIETMDPLEVVSFNPTTTPLTFEARTAGASVGINNTSGINLQYSTDGTNWNDYSSAITLTNIGDIVQFRGNNTSFNQTSSVHTFTCTGNCYIYGNIMSLLHAEEYATNYTLPEYAFYRLFYNNYRVDIHPDKELVLPATQLANYCYKGMFQGSGLTKVPALPATHLADYCYQNMFTNCQSLTTVPNDLLPATTLAYACYHYMFYQCSSLTNTPALPATELADFCCQYMFAECTNLATVHKLPATTLATSCYSYMFYECMSLETVPDDLLPATTLANGCYNTMFRGCTNLTTAPELPASNLVYLCYSGMFRGCQNLNSVTCLATSGFDAGLCLSNWMNGVAATGTFTKASGVTWPTGPSGIPSGWITYKFSVSATQAVQFAPGNLQYKSGEGWRFAEHQYDYIGAWDATNWVDYFGWGTWGEGQNPLQTVKNSSSYHWSTDFQGTLNGHNDWYTLTSSEWNYLFTGRENASSLYGHATVNGVHGIIVLPDASTLSINSTSHNWSANVIDATTWTNTYEADGAMFLPAAGQRYGTDVEDVNSYGYYWSSTTASGNNAYELLIASSSVYAASNTDNYYYGNSVRLARIVQQ